MAHACKSCCGGRELGSQVLTAGGRETGAAQGVAVGGGTGDSSYRRMLKDVVSNTNSSNTKEEAGL